MIKLKIKTKEIQLLALFGILTLLFISVNTSHLFNSADNNSNLGPYNLENDFPKTSAPTINIVSPTTNQYFNATAPYFEVKIHCLSEQLFTSCPGLDTLNPKFIITNHQHLYINNNLDLYQLQK